MSSGHAHTHWIGGAGVRSLDAGVVEVRDPSTEDVFATVPRGCAADAEAALNAAAGARQAWADRSPSDRAALLRAGLRKIESSRDAIATLLTRENGKPLAHASAEVDAAVTTSLSLIELGIQLAGRHVNAGGDELLFQVREPRGVAVCLNTWNAPVVAGVEMAVANLIVGNTLVLKTSERAPLATRLALETAFAALPAGVINVVSGDGRGMGEPLLAADAPGVGVVCFIGSAAVGRRVGAAAGGRLRKAILELGGKNALIVDDTIDPAAAARFAAPSCFANTGQICTCTERIYVHRRVHDAFVDHLRKLAAELRVGPGADPKTEIGPMIAADVRERVEAHVAAAVTDGATVVTGGRRPDRRGYYFPPTVLTQVTDSMTIARDETFGPIAPVAIVDSFDEAIERANRSPFGLSALVCTESAPNAIRAIHRLNVGMVRINSPRGQVPHCAGEPANDSGLGLGHGIEFLEELTYRKAVRWRDRLPGG